MPKNLNFSQVPSHEMSENERREFAKKLQSQSYPEQIRILYQHHFIIPQWNTGHRPMAIIQRKITWEQFLLEKGKGIFPIAWHLFFEDIYCLNDDINTNYCETLFFRFKIQWEFYLFQLSSHDMASWDWRWLKQISAYNKSSWAFKTGEEIVSMVRLILEPTPSNSLC